MSKSIFKKAAAIICSATALAALTMAASAEIKGTYNQIDSTKPYFATERVTVDLEDAKKGQIPVSVYLYNAPEDGWCGIGASVSYDNKLLKPVANPDDPTNEELVKYDLGPAASQCADTVGVNADLGILALPLMKATPKKTSGVLVTYYLDIIDPDMKVGSKYDLKFCLERFSDVNKDPIACENPASSQTNKEEMPEQFNGYIEIVGAATSTTTTSTTESTTSTTKTTTSTTKTTTSTTKTTTSTTGTTTSTSGTTAKTTSSGTTKATTKSTTAATTKATTKAGTTTAAATKTGDAGVGLAVVALLTAAGTAVVATKKKED